MLTHAGDKTVRWNSKLRRYNLILDWCSSKGSWEGDISFHEHPLPSTAGVAVDSLAGDGEQHVRTQTASEPVSMFKVQEVGKWWRSASLRLLRS